MRSYITLDGLAELVYRGEEIRVVDNDSEEELTSVILSQILLERERAQRFVPSAVLSQLLRSGETLSKGLSKVARPFVNPPALPVPQFLEQEIEKTLKFWSELGQNSEEETLRLIEKLVEKRRRARSEVEVVATPVVRRSRSSGSNLDKFEEWGGDNVKAPPDLIRPLPAELVTESLKAARELSETLVYHVENRNLLTQEEIDRLQGKLKDICTHLGVLQDELNHFLKSS